MPDSADHDICDYGDYYDAKTSRKPKVKRRSLWMVFQIRRLLLKVIRIKNYVMLTSSSSRTWAITLGMTVCFLLFMVVLNLLTKIATRILLKTKHIGYHRSRHRHHYAQHNHDLLHHHIVSSIRSEDLSRYYSHVHPTTIRYIDSSETKNHVRPVHYSYPTKRHLREWAERDRNGQLQLWDDEWYDSVSVRPFKPYDKMSECQPMHPWQTLQYPTCNVMHEQHLDDLHWGKFISHGYFRQTFEIYDPGTDKPIAMKTLRNERSFTPNLMERHRVDAMIYERTTASPWITDIYGHCGYSGLFEYAAGGTLMDLIHDIAKGRRPPLSRMEKLSLAIQAANGVSDLHTNKDSIDGYSSMVHADVFLNQFVWSENKYKLNDFNRGHLMWWNEERHESCPYLWLDGNAGNFRSPEEFKEDWQTEKIDVFSLGNIIYAIITGSLPFEEMDVKDAQEMVKNGILPKLKESFIHSDHPIDNVLVKAMDMCFEYDWRKRARAHQVRDLLMNEMENVKELYHKNGKHDDEFVRRHQHEQHGEDGHRHNRRH